MRLVVVRARRNDTHPRLTCDAVPLLSLLPPAAPAPDIVQSQSQMPHRRRCHLHRSREHMHNLSVEDVESVWHSLHEEADKFT